MALQKRTTIGTPLFDNSAKLMLLGGGELGREVAIEAMRLGAEVVVVDRYDNAPAMQVAHRKYVVNMTDGNALAAIIAREKPSAVIPEIEAINTDTLVRLEQDGVNVIPNANATKTTMNRELIRRLASEKAGVKTSKYEFADNLEEAAAACEKIGFPCVMKALMSSSGLGSSIVKSRADVKASYEFAQSNARTKNARVIVEEFVKFELEVTELPVRHFDENGKITTSFCKPIGHKRPGTHYHESWQPAGVSEKVEQKIYDIAGKVSGALGGIGVFGCELFIAGDEVYFNEISPRPHDTGLVTCATQDLSEFALHARAVLGLPIPKINLLTPGAAHVILSHKEGTWAPKFGNLDKAFAIENARVMLFGKPSTFVERRLGIALAIDRETGIARQKAEQAAHAVEEAIEY